MSRSFFFEQQTGNKRNMTQTQKANFNKLHSKSGPQTLRRPQGRRNIHTDPRDSIQSVADFLLPFGRLLLLLALLKIILHTILVAASVQVQRVDHLFCLVHLGVLRERSQPHTATHGRG